MHQLTAPFLSIFALAGAALAQQPGSLFDGKTLDGWKVVTCEAEVADGAILIKGGNGFLLADKQYGDFVFACDWKALNTDMWDSGIYFRADKLPEPGAKFPWPSQHQVNMRKGEEGALPDTDKAACSRLFKKGEWNHFKLTVKGEEAELEFNGQKAWTKGGIKPPKGYLCLQAEVPGGGQFLFKNLTIVEQP
jgi:hypothetical protein